VDTKYAKSGDLSIAYQVLGDGPIDLVLVPGIVSHVEFFHEIPGYTDYLERLGRFGRVITFDKRGSGLSDRPAHVGTLEERMDDMRAVMDAVGTSRAALLGWSEGGPLSILFAATYPERVSHLVLSGTFACYVGDALHGEVLVPELFRPFVESLVEHWGDGTFCRMLAPTAAQDVASHEMFARVERYSASPQTVRGLWEAVGEIDVRPILPSVRAPTLVLRRDGEVMPEAPCRYIADRVPDGRFVTLPGSDHVPWIGDTATFVATVEEFVTGHTAAVDDDQHRVLATVLFTDVVGSTARAAAVGDARWRMTLDRFQEGVRREIVRHRGREVNTRGDDFLIAFDGPARAIRCARAINDAARPLHVEVRSGIHTGEVELRDDDRPRPRRRLRSPLRRPRRARAQGRAGRVAPRRRPRLIGR